ncbi:hypothetical protein DSO57_1027608 [Entomophthora muscae]|uniref:Uncharacterized protein n=1 Tax=Entomophthora muscae TaxID=34485 RepID=A0ACC2RGF4_9FUNG|nr:hypothetical protein DSO57_1027608 [Entomophthora muscae]
MDLSDFLPKKLAKQIKETENDKKNAEAFQDNSYDDPLRAFLPSSFGKPQNSQRAAKLQVTSQEPVIIEKVNTSTKTEEAEAEVPNDDDDDSESPSEDDDELHLDLLPLTHEAKLLSHSKLISGLTIDRAGARLVSGSYDHTIKMWDFTGMDSGMRAFRSFEAEEGQHIHDLQYSLSGDQLLVIAGGMQAKIFSREGQELMKFMKGDPYLRDLRHTKGHVSALTCGQWHPYDRDCILTASQDNSIRIWDANNPAKHRDIIIVQSKQRGGRSPVSAATFSHDGILVAGASQDGSLSLWPSKGPFTRPASTIADAHQFNSDTSSLVFSKNNHHLVSRGGDDTVKLWDVRNFTKPLLQASDLLNLNTETNIVFSPDEKLIVTGVGVKRGEGYGQLVFLDRTSLEIVRSINVAQSSAVKVVWHAALNQIAVGSGDGSITMYYDPIRSLRGAKLCVSRQPRKRHIDDFEIQRPIMTPHDPPTRISKRQRDKMRSDPIATRRPDLPSSGPGKAGSNFTNHIMKQIIKDTTRGCQKM